MPQVNNAAGVRNAIDRFVWYGSNGKVFLRRRKLTPPRSFGERLLTSQACRPLLMNSPPFSPTGSRAPGSA